MRYKLALCPFWCSMIVVCAALAYQPANGQTPAEAVEALLTRYHDYGLFNGAALVAQEGNVIYKGGFGAANMAWDIPNTADTRFRIASSTKQFTAALVLTLMEEGRIHLDSTIATYLPEYPKAQGTRVTVHHLLTHTSGIPSYTSLPGFMSDEVRDPLAPDSILALVSGMDLTFPPGTRWAYSNSGYILLGAIVEAVTGQTYEEALHERVLDPLGLHNTGYDHYSEIVTRQAAGYVQTVGGFQRAPYLDTSVPYSAGMLYSTVEDLYKWDQKLYGLGPFDKAGTKELFLSAHEPLPDGMSQSYGLPLSYGYGWFVGPVAVAGDTVKVIEHGGSIFGYTTGFWRMPDERNTVILMDNTSSGRLREIGEAIRSILYGESPSPPERPIAGLLHETINAGGIEAGRQRYGDLCERAPADYDCSEAELDRLGHHYLEERQAAAAVQVFRLNTEIYPKSPDAFTALATALIAADRPHTAAENVQKALELEPGHETARALLRQLDEAESVGDHP